MSTRAPRIGTPSRSSSRRCRSPLASDPSARTTRCQGTLGSWQVDSTRPSKRGAPGLRAPYVVTRPSGIARMRRSTSSAVARLAVGSHARRLELHRGAHFAEAARAHPREEPPLEHLDPRVPRQPPGRADLLQRGRGGAAGSFVRGAGCAPRAGLDRHVRAVRRRRRAAADRGAAAHGDAAEEPRGARATPDPDSGRRRARHRGDRAPHHGRRQVPGRDGVLLARPRGGRVKVRIWGARGSIASPGPETMRYGGNTSCVQLVLEDGSTLILDAGTGIRSLGLTNLPVERPLHILLTHLHLDHIQGLMFFAPMFRAESDIVIYGPAATGAAEAPLADRLGRYISAPLTPIDIRELPCHMSFREADPTEWRIGPATIRAGSVTHRGPTLGYRITEGNQTIVYIPDHEPGLGTSLDALEDEWISGLDLACGADLLLHDAQYTDDEYPLHLGWGHSSITDALT